MAGPAAARSPAEITPRRMLGFVAMCVGMFMAILDIQIVSSSLAEIQAGLSASVVGGVVGADRLSHRRDRDDPAFGLPRPRALDPLSLRDRRRRLRDHLDRLLDRQFDRRDDRLARTAGLHRRRHDPVGVRGRLHDLPAQPPGDGLGRSSA